MSFESRWVQTPAHVTERDGGLPAGFRAGGVACGLKPSGRRRPGLPGWPGPGAGQPAACHPQRPRS